jgi:cobaltochelatase CobN
MSTVRISGAFRDTFATQIALIDQAARAIAHLDEDDEWNALAAARRRGSEAARVFGAAPGRYGAGVAREALDGSWQARQDLARAYLDSTSHAFGPKDEGVADPSFAERVAQADAFVHVSDVRERDILDGDAAGDAMGGFAAAAESLGRAPAFYSLDASRAEGPKARTLAEDIARLVRGRLTNARWIEGQLRHGFRGASELAQAVDASSSSPRPRTPSPTPRSTPSTPPMWPIRPYTNACAPQTRPPRRPSSTGWRRRVAEGCGPAGATRSTPISAACGRAAE